MIEAHSRPPSANENKTKIVKIKKYLDLIKAVKGLRPGFRDFQALNLQSSYLST